MNNRSLIDSLFALLSSLLGIFGFVLDQITVSLVTKIFYVLSIYLIILGIREVYEKRSLRKQLLQTPNENVESDATIHERLVNPKAVTTINLSTDPELKIQQMASNTKTLLEVYKIMKSKIKNVFKYIWNNKFSLMNLVVVVAMGVAVNYALFSDVLIKLFPFMESNQILFKCVVCGVSVIVMVLDIFTTINHLGLENLDAINTRLAEAAAIKAAKLTPEQKKVLKNQLARLNEAKGKYVEVVNKLKSEKEEIELLASVGVATSENAAHLSALPALIAQNDAAIAKFDASIKLIEEKLAK